MPPHALLEKGYKPAFSGHETFPPRYGWLKKGLDAVHNAPTPKKAKALFSDQSAIARFGVGKNMVSAIRHWCEVGGVIAATESSDGLSPTRFGKAIFADDGLDPYMEEDATIWLFHAHIAHNVRATSWYWFFNYLDQSTFSRADLVDELQRLGAAQDWQRLSETTIRRDIECLVRTYTGGRGAAFGAHEETADSPLAELGLLRPLGARDRFQLVRGSKPTLPARVFAWALWRFFADRGAAQTASLESLAYEAGAPGRIFLLDEQDLAQRLSTIEADTEGTFRWSETAGLRQVVRVKQVSEAQAFKLATRGMRSTGKERAA
jgi:hypothetical protein